MRIRYLLLNAYAYGGTVRTVVNQANALAAVGHTVEVVSVRRNRAAPPFGLHPAVRLQPLVDGTEPAAARWARPLEAWLAGRPSGLVAESEGQYGRFSRLSDWRLVRYLRGLDGGVLVTTRPALSLLSARFAPAGVVRIGQEHRYYGHYGADLAREIDARYRRLHAVTVLTAADRETYAARLAGAGVRVEQIPHPLSGGAPRRSRLDRPLILSAGRLTADKGFDTLIRAFADVAADHPEWQLRIYGTGPERDRLRALINERHLYNHVYLMGTTPRLERELAKASVFALAAPQAGCGMALAEAMSHGVPPVGFDCPHGPRELIRDGPSPDGVLVSPPGDAGALGRALRKLVEHPELRREMGKRAAESARRYEPGGIRDRWVALCHALLADPPS
ncbi:glycosyltransferase [Streptomyces boncukensis]|uniref:D-inositol 3-phosphate glycosyltransferase n=1 Tax=Streptomyces boncukensis TaxID=2711219 RepID=A0A6G4WVV4_9ACTN|nr:glycosyltransferase family 4 protein [Streptomyces boncukensis]